MSNIQANLCKPCPYAVSARISRSSRHSPVQVVLPVYAFDPLKCSVKLVSVNHHRMPVLKWWQGTAICSFAGKDKSESGSPGSPWNALEKAMGSFKGQSVEDLLRQQIDRQEFYDDGGSGKSPPRGRGGGGGNGSEDSGDEGLAGVVDETLQVILATLGFIFLYIYIITGEELTRLAKDYIKFLFRGGKSVRLKRAMDKWNQFWSMFYERKEVDKHWLEKEIARTNTWYDGPEKYRRIIRSELESDSDDE